MSFPFASETLLPNQTRSTSPSVNNNITNPNDLIVGLLYDFYYSPGRGHAKRLPRGRRTRSQKHKLSRRAKSRRAMRNYASHMWVRLLDNRNNQLLVQPLRYSYDENTNKYVETKTDEPEYIPYANFYYANLETLNEKLEDNSDEQYYENVMEPYRKLITMYAAEKAQPNSAFTLANAYSDGLN